MGQLHQRKKFMKVLLLSVLLMLAPSPAPQVTPTTTATIEGLVLRLGSKDPIPNALVTLIKAAPSGQPMSADAAAALSSLQEIIISNPGLAQTTIDSLATSREQALGLAAGTLSQTNQTTVLTDAAGHFSFKDQTSGKYTVRATLDGFFGPSVNGFPSSSATKTVNIESQKPVPASDIYMSKGGVISGRLRDPNGQPASGVSVAAFRVTYTNGRPQWSQANGKATDDRGEFRIFWLPPGEYYVGITPRAVSAVPSLQDKWTRTFYPGVSDTAAAGVLTVKDGMETPGIDFSVQGSESTGIFKVSGRALNPVAVPNPTTGAVDRTVSSFILSPREPGLLDSLNPPSVQNALAIAARPNGEFELRNVRTGSYDLIAYYMAPIQPAPAPPPTAAGAVAPPLPQVPTNRRYNIGRVRVDVRGSDIDGINLEIERGTEIRGKVVSQGTNAIATDKIKVNLRSQDTIPDAFASIIGAIGVDSNGDFSAQDVPKARYTFSISGLPDGAYVADILQGGTTIFDSGFIVGNQPGASIEIVIAANGGIVEGRVQTADQKPAANATVVLVPSVQHRQNSLMYKTAQSDEKGNFSMKAVPQGEYTMFAWESVPATAWMNAEFLAKYQDRGRPIHVTAGTRMSEQPELIPESNNRP